MTAPAKSAVGFFGKRYRLLGKLGQGGMGEVFKAQDRLTGQVVALKRVAASHSTGPVPAQTTQMHSAIIPQSQVVQTVSRADRFAPDVLHLALVQEFRILASLRHPNIISVLDYGVDKDRLPYFTMELLSAPTTVLEAGQGKPLKTKVDLLAQLLRALSYLHRHGILHRDLKPANVTSGDDRPAILPRRDQALALSSKKGPEGLGGPSCTGGSQVCPLIPFARETSAIADGQQAWKAPRSGGEAQQLFSGGGHQPKEKGAWSRVAFARIDRLKVLPADLSGATRLICPPAHWQPLPGRGPPKHAWWTAARGAGLRRSSGTPTPVPRQEPPAPLR